MATLTIRNLDAPLKSRLRLRAAARNHSMEEEARQILRAALQEPLAPPRQDLAARIRSRFAGLGDIQLVIDPRAPVRPAPDFADAPAPKVAPPPRRSTARRR